ncbi:MAG: protoporphyrinogen oxidase [Planctomycetes bacterium]|nr:protoporphyrinogen oxidase [Planctomycetota bacterium]
MPSLHDTIVLGAGMSGLSYAHARGADADVVVLEAAPRAGGLVTTQREPGLHFECGPEALQDDAPLTVRLIEDMSLRVLPADPSAKNRWVLGAGGLVPVPTNPGAFLKSPLVSLPGKLRAFTEPLRKKGVALDGSVADFVRHRLGGEILRELVDPALAGIYAGSAETTSLRAAFPKLYDMAAEHGSIMGGLKAKAKARKAKGESRPPPPSLLSVEGGLQRLPDAIGAWLGARLRLDCAARGVTRASDGWEVATDDGVLRARRLVLATPARAASGLLADAAPELSALLGEIVTEIVVSVAHVWPRAQVRHPLDGFGYLVPTARGLKHLGTLFSSSITPSRCPSDVVVLRTLCGGARDPAAIGMSDDALLALLRAEVAPLLGLPDGPPRLLHVTRWKASLPRYDLAQPARQDALEALLARHAGLSVLGNHRRGISVNALVENGTRLAELHLAEDGAA